MRIVIVSPSYPPSLWNNIGRTTYSIAQGLAQAGHTVTVLSYNPAIGNKFARDKSVRIEYLGVNGDATLPLINLAAWQDKVTAFLNNFCKSWDKIICIDSYGYRAIMNSNVNIPVIGLCNFFYTATGWLQSIGKELETDLKQQELDFITKSDIVLCNNVVTKKKVEMVSNRSVHLYTIGIPEIKGFEHAPKKKQVLYVGKLNREKGIERIIRVMPKLEWVHLVLCDQNANNSYKVVIGKLAAELGVISRISYTGFLTTQQVWKLYIESEICVVPHIVEPFGYAAIYPMMLGTPTIASNANGLPAIIGSDGDSGAVFSNIEELKYYLEEVHQMETLQQMYGENGRKRVLEEHSLEKMLASITVHL